ncbi:conserved hypothetical protein [Candidatus Desulfobacillus denitrificans]|uniref:Uncharacterized protein n=1 Tax=Candidatus Desulfobacillus denitrificans TaxID=2608985 RepID=A0A809S2W6_9PROT|nr:hypothetical protein [Rhodocyclaceae bacterium]BBO19901.1 conserved hypothetical protein [Candidatus Desulfobacillus denitrificans]
MRTRLPSLARSAVIPAKAGIRHLARALVAGALLASALPAGAETLGRLFFTPERRAALERQRQLNIRETQKTIEGAELGVSGIVQRSSGKNTAWVNNAPLDEHSTEAGVRVQVDRASPGKATVIAGEETPASLKVGETINRATRETSTGVGEGHITVKPAARPK